MAEVLIQPLITEKLTAQSERLGKYGFVVSKGTNKVQIKKAVEDMYGVNVRDVRTMVIPAKSVVRYTKLGYMKGRKAGFKKAIVTLMEGETIDFYSNI